MKTTKTVKTGWKDIKIGDLQKGQFIIFHYHKNGSNCIIAKILTDFIDESIDINIIADNFSGKIDLDEIEKDFVLRDFRLQYKIQKEGNDLKIERNWINRIILIDEKLLKKMARKEQKKKKEAITETKKRERDFKETMRGLGLLPIPRTKK